jgi:hypothetical protein
VWVFFQLIIYANGKKNVFESDILQKERWKVIWIISNWVWIDEGCNGNDNNNFLTKLIQFEIVYLEYLKLKCIFGIKN